jgi:acid phosphatase
MKKLYTTLTAIALLCCGCAGTYTERTNLNSVTWMQTSDEYRALSVGAYNMARQNLDRALEDSTWTALPSQIPSNSNQARALAKLPPAVILDIDETVLDTLPFQAWLMKNNRTFAPMSWHAWVSEAGAEAIPGALDFVHYAMGRGVTVFYLSNRAARGVLDLNKNGRLEPGEAQVDLKPFTISNLTRLGFLPQKNVSNDDSVLLRNKKDSDKTARRESLSTDYRVVLIIGDNRNDIISEDTPDALEQYREHWGRSWIMLPNPAYGSWERRLYDFRRTLSSEEKTRIKLDSLDTWQ